MRKQMAGQKETGVRSHACRGARSMHTCRRMMVNGGGSDRPAGAGHRPPRLPWLQLPFLRSWVRTSWGTSSNLLRPLIWSTVSIWGDRPAGVAQGARAPSTQSSRGSLPALLRSPGGRHKPPGVVKARSLQCCDARRVEARCKCVSPRAERRAVPAAHRRGGRRAGSQSRPPGADCQTGRSAPRASGACMSGDETYGKVERCVAWCRVTKSGRATGS
jgi:hypothetical protein